MIDFKSKIKQGSIEKKINPIDLYNTLDRKTNTGPLRPTQERILTKWFNDRRDDKELIIKLNTGAGKTLIGLLILQSILNADKGPCLYVCPNKYLVKQVCDEAEKFGVPFCVFEEEKNIIPEDFSNGKKILITHAIKIFNGKTVFGLDNQYEKAGAVVLDDSHACIDAIKEAFTINIDRDNELYNEILELFQEDLIEQGSGSLQDIKDGEYDEIMMIPYWAWFEKKDNVLRLLSKYKTRDMVKFSWELLKNSIISCNCYISGNKIEITHNNPSVEKFSTFSKAHYKILMSATTQDDSFFVKGLFFPEEAIINPLTDEIVKWSGEKMIIFSSAMGEKCDREYFITEFSKIKKEKVGMVSIVPSKTRLSLYEENGIVCIDKNNDFQEIKKLKNGEFGKLVAFLNKYDGIDLPDESCRVLILDSLPRFSTLSGKYEEKCRSDSLVIDKKIAQKIEQGLGRSVRGEKDFSAIIIIGDDIDQFMHRNDTKKLFSPQTIKQIEIGEKLSNYAKQDRNEEDSPFKPIYDLIEQMLARDEGWKEYYETEMNTICEKNNSSDFYRLLEKEVDAEKAFCLGDYGEAAEKMQKLINENRVSQSDKGWYLQQLARYKYFINKTESKNTQFAAYKENSMLLKSNVCNSNGDIDCKRMEKIKEYINKYRNYEELDQTVNTYLMSLRFGETAEKFEKALHEVGLLLGFECERPDKEKGVGPDNIWELKGEFQCFECKSEMKKERDSISKHEIGQMSNHIAWFKEQKGKEAKARFFFVAPTYIIDQKANCETELRVINEEKLNKLKDNIKGFIQEIINCKWQSLTVDYLQNSIKNNHLDYKDFVDRYSIQCVYDK